MSLWGQGFEVCLGYFQVSWSTSCCLQDVKLSATNPALHLPACLHVSCHDDNGPNLGNCKQAAPNELFPL